MPHWPRIRDLCGRGDKKTMRAGSGGLPGMQEVDVIPRKQSCRHSKMKAEMNWKSVRAPARPAAVQAHHWEGDVDASFLQWSAISPTPGGQHKMDSRFFAFFFFCETFVTFCLIVILFACFDFGF